MSSRSFITDLYRAPEINPLNNKARTFPILNVMNIYGRTFHLSWLGFFIAFLSWFAFPPLLHGTLKTDLKMTQIDVANSNIVSLLATLLVRVGVGPLCDRFGPRYVMVGCLALGSIPTAMAGLVQTPQGLIALRFFVGVLGGTFVPCQVWTTGFYDKNIVGRVKGFGGGWGNAGGGVTFFVMPAVVEALQKAGYSDHQAWRIAFPACPFVCIVVIAIMVLVLGQDCPAGKWANRANIPGLAGGSGDYSKSTVVDVHADNAFAAPGGNGAAAHEMAGYGKGDTKLEAAMAPMDVAEGKAELAEVAAEPTWRDTARVAFSKEILLTALPYVCTFGGELAIEGVISNLYTTVAKKSHKVWGQETAGNWAALFGLLNVVTRPAGGYLSDIIYRRTGSVVSKKWWIVFLGLMEGGFFLLAGLDTGLQIYPLIGVMTGLAIFMEAGNGANFSLVPHIHPSHNGVVSGITGASGNLGGVFFNLVFRFKGTDYYSAMWIIGVCCLACHLFIVWIPVPRQH